MRCPECDAPLKSTSDATVFVCERKCGMWSSPAQLAFTPTNAAIAFDCPRCTTRSLVAGDDGQRPLRQCRHCKGVWMAPQQARGSSWLQELAEIELFDGEGSLFDFFGDDGGGSDDDGADAGD